MYAVAVENLFIPNAQAMQILGIARTQYATDLRILRTLRDRGLISANFDNYPRDPVLSPIAFEILKRYRELVTIAGVRLATQQIKKEYPNNSNER